MFSIGGFIMAIGKRIRFFRNRKGMTQKQFAAYFRIPYRTLEDWERGVRHIAEYLLRLMIYRLEMEGLARGLSEKMPD